MGRGEIFRASIALAALLCGASAPAPRIEAQWEAGTPSRFAMRILELHNAERARLHLPPLVWSETLAADAAGWANTLAAADRFEHSPGAERRGQGENLFRGSAGDWSLDEMIGDFLEERADFHPGRFPDVANDGAWEHVGHYTQIIWRGSREVGCAVVRGRGWDYLACRYAPAGNVMGERVP